MTAVDDSLPKFNAQIVDPGECIQSLSELQVVHQAISIDSVEPLVAIFLCTFNGKDFLLEQLDSIAKQSHRNWRLYVSDDGNCDETRAAINTFRARFEAGRVIVVVGPREGFVANFLSITCDASIEADYFAYSDQDDIWHTNKLEKSVKFLSVQDEKIPSLYCSRTVIVSKDNRNIGLSPLFLKTPTFGNALVQNIAGGNTMVFNKKARELAIKAGSDVSVTSHDWWMYLLVSGSNGIIKYDPEPTIRYRQHDTNIVGYNSSWRARSYRIYMLFMGRFKDYNERNICALFTVYHLLSPENQKLLDQFSELRNSKFFQRLYIFSKIRIYRQTIFGNLGLFVGVILNKL